MSREHASVEQRVIDLVADVAGVAPSDIDVTVEFTSFGMGSLERLECVLNIEDAFQVELEESDLRKLRTVRELIASVEDAVARQRHAT
jgi:acyl carrier protein